MKQVTVTVTSQAIATIETAGFQGSGCKDIVEGITKALAAQVLDDKKKPEFFEEEVAGTGVRTGW